MITYLQTDLFTSPAQTLVNTVNTVGVMGKGIAKSFKEKYPAMFAEYKQLCDSGKINIGNLHLWRGPTKWILNFPTKTTWKKPSQFEYIEKGLIKFIDSYESLGITSISFPPLGCGNGQLDWRSVRPLIEHYLRKLPIQVFIHEIPVGHDFVAEHLEQNTSDIPASFEKFIKDISTIMQTEKGQFSTLSGSSDFDAAVIDDEAIRIRREGGSSQNITREALLLAWSILQAGVLSSDQFNDQNESRQKSYLFPILARLPYINLTRTSNSRDQKEKYALVLRGREPAPSSEPQGSLWQSH